MTDELRCYLTEKVLGECWHERANPGNTEQPRCTCGAVNDSAFALNEGHIFKVRRTFATEADMMVCYRVLFKTGKWEEFCNFSMDVWVMDNDLSSIEDTIPFVAWLFCLSGEGYEDRCKMVAEFVGWKG